MGVHTKVQFHLFVTYQKKFYSANCITYEVYLTLLLNIACSHELTPVRAKKFLNILYIKKGIRH